MRDARADRLVSKAQLSRELGVSATMISKYIQTGKIADACIHGAGARQMIWLERAKQSLRETLHAGQRMGQAHRAKLGADRVAARLAAIGAEPEASQQAHHGEPTGVGLLPDKDDTAADALRGGRESEAARYQRLRSKAVELEIEKRRDEAALRRGIYIMRAEAEAQITRELQGIIASAELWLCDLAKVLGDELAVERPKALALIRREWRAWRLKTSEKLRARAETLPETVEITPTIQELAA